jgi:transcriptional regulator with XRE-family HTH domain
MSEEISGRQIAVARALLGLSQGELARKAKISTPALIRMEAKFGEAVGLINNIAAVRAALEDAGIEFMNGDEPGTLSSYFNPQLAKEGSSHEHKQYISAVFLGRKTSPRMAAWNAFSEAERLAKQQEGIAAWKVWAEKRHTAIVGMGGPLRKTKKVTARGVEDTSNELSAYTVVYADSHEAAAKLFEKHPHFMIFPGDSVEIMPVLPIPGA